ncbi:MAG: hypothetical protein ACKV0T_06195 [Planctomycetales bacterium]
MSNCEHWTKEPGARLAGNRDLDRFKVQAPCVVPLPGGGFRMFYTAVGPGKPFPACQGYILSAVSDDGLNFRADPGIRLAPNPSVATRALRVLAPSIARCPDGRWRMYVETRGTAAEPTVIASAISTDMLHWEFEAGVRVQTPGGVGGPRFLTLPDGRGRLYCIRSDYGPAGVASGKRLSSHVISAITTDGLRFEIETGVRLADRQRDFDSAGITAAEVLPPDGLEDLWRMYYSAWQECPSGMAVPVHPSHDSAAVANGRSDDFAAQSIASDMSGYRSRIFEARSPDGLTWNTAGCVIEGTGYGADGLDAVHAEDMSLVDLGAGGRRMYYAACDREGVWRIASAFCADQ